MSHYSELDRLQKVAICLLMGWSDKKTAQRFIRKMSEGLGVCSLDHLESRTEVIRQLVNGNDLIDMANEEELAENELVKALEAYTTPGHPEYDPVFDRKIRAIRPDWFEHKNN